MLTAGGRRAGVGAGRVGRRLLRRDNGRLDQSEWWEERRALPSVICCTFAMSKRWPSDVELLSSSNIKCYAPTGFHPPPFNHLEDTINPVAVEYY